LSTRPSDKFASDKYLTVEPFYHRVCWPIIIEGFIRK